MALKRLGGVSPTLNTNTLLYQVPSGKNTSVSTINVCNRSGLAIKFRIAHIAGDGIIAVSNSDYVAFDVPLSAYNSLSITVGMAMGSNDSIMVRADSSEVTFIAWGNESTTI